MRNIIKKGKVMKQMFLMCALISILNIACANQKIPKTPEQRAAKKTEVLAKKLNLSANQAIKVRRIMLSQAIRIDSLKNNRQPTRRANRLAHRNILAQTDERMYTVLNPEQKKDYTNWVEKRRERRQAKKQNAG
ncbi:hypothetical protein [Mucilaginibacter sp.]